MATTKQSVETPETPIEGADGEKRAGGASLSVKGLATAVVAIATFLGARYGFDFDSEKIQTLVEASAVVVLTLVSIWKTKRG